MKTFVFLLGIQPRLHLVVTKKGFSSFTSVLLTIRFVYIYKHIVAIFFYTLHNYLLRIQCMEKLSAQPWT